MLQPWLVINPLIIYPKLHIDNRRNEHELYRQIRMVINELERELAMYSNFIGPNVPVQGNKIFGDLSARELPAVEGGDTIAPAAQGMGDQRAAESLAEAVGDSMVPTAQGMGLAPIGAVAWGHALPSAITFNACSFISLPEHL
jgi:hypothetical protein